MIGLYPRVSTQEQAKEGYSIGEQIERLTKYCEAMGWSEFKFYTDAGHSGADMERPGLKDLIADVEAGKISKVVVYKLDRLSRSQKDTLTLIEDIFLKNGADFVSMTENFDTSTPLGRAMIGILSVFAQLEREQIKERMSVGKEGRAKKGKWHGGSTSPVGYDYVAEDDMLYVNEYEKMQILELYDLYLKGVPLTRIEKIFLEKGYTHKHGDWTPKVMKRVMTNPLNIGYLRWEGNLYKGLQDAIIDEETFRKAEKMVQERSEEYKAKYKRTSYYSTYLGGMIKCAHCGAGYHVCHEKRKGNSVSPKKYGCYSRSKKARKMIIDPNCKNKYWKMEELDNLVFDQIRQLATEPNAIREIRGAKQSDIPEKIAVMEKEIAKLKAQKSRYMDLFSIEEITIEEFKEKKAPLEERIKKLEHEISVLSEGTAKLSESDTREIVDKFEDILDRNDFDEIRLTLNALIDFIEIDNEDVTIHWNFV